jgi:hypothetical protein
MEMAGEREGMLADRCHILAERPDPISQATIFCGD